MSSFVKALRRFGDNAINATTAVLRESVTGVTEELVDLTPYVTGKARSSYFWGASANVGGLSTDAVSEDGAPSMQRAKDFASAIVAGGKIHVVLAVTYGAELEFGTSTRAPSAMFRTVEQRWKSIGLEAEKRAMAKGGMS